MKDIVLYNSQGNPIKPDKTRLNQEIAAPSLMGVRSIWRDAVVPGLTPISLARLLQDAGHGEASAYLTLAEEMEEKDLHYASVIGTRKRAVSRLPVNVEAAADDSKSVKIADSVRTLVKQSAFRGLLTDAMDAIGKGFSVTEILWNTAKTPWTPARYAWRDPRFFVFDQNDMQEIRLKDMADPIHGIPLDPYKFIVHHPKLKSGIPIRSGIAYLACWSWLFKNYTIRDWMAFSEVFGMPIRVGKYGSGATPDEIDILKLAVSNIGVDAAAVVPESMMIEIIEQSARNGENLFKIAADWFDSQVSKGVLGQTATTQGTPGKLGGDEAQSEVRQDIRDSDAEQLEETLNRDLVVPFVILNFGPQEVYPRLTLKEPDAEDLKLLVEALEKLVPLGLEVEQSVIRDKLGLPDPEEGAKLLSSSPPPVETPELGVSTSPQEPAMNNDGGRRNEPLPSFRAERCSDPESRQGIRDLDSGIRRNDGDGVSRFTPEQEALEDLADRAILEAAAGLAANEEALLSAIMESQSYEEALSKLLERFPALSMDALTGAMEQAMLSAGLFGQWTTEKEGRA
jgi:phage gp29-like protein